MVHAEYGKSAVTNNAFPAEPREGRRDDGVKLKQCIVSPQGEGERVDRLIARNFPELPERSVRAAFLRRDVKLDGRRVSREEKARAGQEIRIYLTEDAEDQPLLRIVYEDTDALLVNKPAGISVEPDRKGGVTLTDLCVHHVREADPGAEAPAACHRLDHQTSGLCLFAKNAEALETLQEVFRARRLEKTYECLVRGIPKPPAAECRAYLIKDAKAGRVRVLDHPAPEGKVILTAYETLEAGPVSRLRVRLLTGRTHQIRAHLAALGHPILGDDVYGDRGWNREKKTRMLKLCAVSLRMDTGGALPGLDGREFRIDPPF